MAMFPSLLTPLLMAGVVLRHMHVDDPTWRGARYDDGEFEVLLLAGDKGESFGAKLGVPGAPAGLSFRLRQQSAYDTIAKALGFAHELEVGQSSFDLTVFIEANDPIVAEAIAGDRALRAALQAIVRLDSASCRFRRLVCRDGRLWLEFRTPTGGREPTVAVLRTYAKTLTALRDALVARAEGRTPFVDETARPTSLLLAASATLGALGFGAIFFIDWNWNTTDVDRLWHTSVLAGLCAFGVLVAIAFATARRSARFHLLLAELVLMGAASCVMLAAMLVGWANRAFDDSIPQPIETHIDDGYIERHRRSSSYFVLPRPNDWPTYVAVGAVQVSGGTYDELGRARGAVFSVRRGALGIPWYDSVRPWTPPDLPDD